MNKTRKNPNWLQIIFSIVYIFTYFAFVVCLVRHWAVGLYILGLLLLAGVFIEFLSSLLSKGKLKMMDWICMCVSFVSFVVILSIYIAGIPQDNLRTVITALASSSLGGLLTLTGVGLTVKYTRIYREEENVERIKPHMFTVGTNFWMNLPKEKHNVTYPEIDRACLRNEEPGDIHYSITLMRLGNSDISISILRGLFINDKFIRFKYEIPLTKESYNELIFRDFNMYEKDEIHSISLLCEDIMENKYLIKLGFEIDERGNVKFIKIKSCFNPEKY